jgi:nucleotide-binding universal stress UspA family protein
MYKHILVPTDGSELADKAVDAALDFARETGAQVTCFTAVPEYQVPGEAELMSRRAISPEQHERDTRRQAEEILGKVAERARAAGVAFGSDFAQCDRPHEAIIQAAEKHRCDLIFIASHGRRGISKLVHGSETQGVLTHSSIPTLVFR